MIRNVCLTKASAILVVLSALVLFVGTPGFTQASGAPECAPLNPEFLDYLQRLNYSTNNLPIGEPESGVIPETLDFSHLSSERSLNDLEILSLPTSYDLRPLGKLTPMRNQGGCGSCWSFATYGSLESSLMPTLSWDGSENNLKNTHGFDLSCCSGGNRTMSTSYLARWSGAVAESGDPYNAGSCSSPSGLAAAKHVQDVVYFPDRTGPLDNDTLKQAVMTYGALYTSYYHNDTYYNSSTYGYYYSGSTSANHAICIVGWDDNFDRTKFRTAPPGNGAWIIRNSWGSWWGQAGYFYMSYYDSLIGKSNCAFIAEANATYDAVYQHDPLGWITSSGYGGNTAWFANVFTATSSTNIAAASWYFGANNCTYELRVYLNPTSGPVTGGTLMSTKTGTVATAGYHTVALDTLVPVASGQKFSVVVKQTTPGYGYPVPLERPYSGYASSATASAGQSYMSSSGTSWTDVAVSYGNTNVCLKAFGKQSSTPPPTAGALSVAPATNLASSGPVGGPFSPISQAYTLSNTGNALITWTASASQPWVTLSSTMGTLAAGTSATVTVTINSSANSLASGSYSNTITFTNTTNGTGNTTRSVALSVNAPPAAGNLAVSPATGLSSSGAVGGPFSPSSQSYTLTNTGGSSISWTAAKTQSWCTLSSIAGTLNPGTSASVTVSINSGANALAAGSYSDTVSLTNTTNGSGNTSRSVNLSVTATQPPPSNGYSIVPAAYAWVDPSLHTRVYLGDDSVSTGITLPFTFQFYGKPYTRVYIGSNGLLGFAATGMTSAYNTVLPAGPNPNATVCAYWDDLNPGMGGAVRYGVVGAAPNRRMVISWTGVPRYSSTTTKFTFQAILLEGSNDIVLQYQNVVPTSTTYGSGRSATIGIENEAGTVGSLYSYNRVLVSNNSAIRFTTTPQTSGYPNARWPRRGW